MSPNEQELLTTLAQNAYIDIAQLIMVIAGYGIFLTQVKYTFVKALPGGLVAQFQLSGKQTIAWRSMPLWATTINMILSDGIVVWRAWILLKYNHIRRLALGCLMVANIAVNIADCIWADVHLETEISTHPKTLDWVANMLSFLVNVCATFLISLQARSQHRMMHNASLHKKTRAQHILLLLVESGAIYCVIQAVFEVSILLQVYSTVTNLSFVEAMNTITSIFGIVSACYPVAVIILVLKDASPIVEIFDQTLDTHQNSHLAHSDPQVLQEEYNRT
ncbi:hypothetical protein FB446DRAFT_704387 [Lentinula raphanica]|nr:hypothetical protein FB446DRAFT_704387 [Lentinula raphanica]